MDLLSGVIHVAVITDDLDRFIDFYTSAFDMQAIFEESTPAFRHAILLAGRDSWIHPVQVADNAHGHASRAMFDRGHLDHLGLTVASREALDEIRRRLVERGASDGMIEDLGAMHVIWCEDPDGMQVELCLIVDAQLRGFHEPRALVQAG